MHRSLTVSLLMIVVVALPWSVGQTEEPETFQRMLSNYESIRQALLHDKVAEAASQIRKLSQVLAADATEEFLTLLPAIRDASDPLSEATTISDARETLGELSEAMVQYQRLVKDPVTVVAFCPMVRKTWIQPISEIGNPLLWP